MSPELTVTVTGGVAGEDSHELRDALGVSSGDVYVAQCDLDVLHIGHAGEIHNVLLEVRRVDHSAAYHGFAKTADGGDTGTSDTR